jgi:hypothetical protein
LPIYASSVHAQRFPHILFRGSAPSFALKYLVCVPESNKSQQIKCANPFQDFKTRSFMPAACQHLATVVRLSRDARGRLGLVSLRDREVEQFRELHVGLSQLRVEPVRQQRHLLFGIV